MNFIICENAWESKNAKAGKKLSWWREVVCDVHMKIKINFLFLQSRFNLDQFEGISKENVINDSNPENISGKFYNIFLSKRSSIFLLFFPRYCWAKSCTLIILVCHFITTISTTLNCNDNWKVKRKKQKKWKIINCMKKKKNYCE